MPFDLGGFDNIPTWLWGVIIAVFVIWYFKHKQGKGSK